MNDRPAQPIQPKDYDERVYRKGNPPHRVRNASGRDRLSFPFFLDPGFAAEIPPLPGRAAVTEAGQPRWDGQNLHAFTGTYGDYLLGKVAKVFPQLQRAVLTDEAPAAAQP